MDRLYHQRILRRLRGRPGLERVAAKLMGTLRAGVPGPRYRAPDFIPDPVTRPASSPIFVSARFRSGSTLLWQAFDRLEGFTAFYEPLNERRWFDPATRGSGTDTSHRGASDYAAHYEGLEHLAQWFTIGWTYRNIAMGPDSRDDALVSYIRALVAAVAERPVLQFNRVDFRLPFLRATFPEAAIVNLRRNSRDVWRSTLRGEANDHRWRLMDFDAHCRFYLMPWYRDLMISFPWVAQDGRYCHPYFVHHLVSRLSDLFADEWADISLRYEDLCGDFTGQMAGLMHHLGGAEGVDLSPLEGLMAPRTEGYDHSADAAFYAEQEAAVEALLVHNLHP